MADINNLVPYANTFGKTSVSGSEILNEAGLYLFKLKDEAGWEAEFYIFLDNSETKFCKSVRLRRAVNILNQPHSTMSQVIQLLFGNP